MKQLDLSTPNLLKRLAEVDKDRAYRSARNKVVNAEKKAAKAMESELRALLVNGKEETES